MSEDLSAASVGADFEEVKNNFEKLRTLFASLNTYQSDPQALKEILDIIHQLRGVAIEMGHKVFANSFKHLESIVRSVSKGQESRYTGLSYALNVFEIIESALLESDPPMTPESVGEEELEMIEAIYQMYIAEKKEKRALSEMERATVDKVFKEVTFFEFGSVNADQRMLIEDFIEEALDPMEEIEDKLLAAESNPSTLEIDGVFRHLHSLKGTASFLQLSSIQHVSHAGESLLSNYRQDRKKLDSNVIRLVLRVVDMIRALINNLKMKLEQSKDGKARFPSVIHMEPLLSAIESVIAGKTIDLQILEDSESQFDMGSSSGNAAPDASEATIRISTSKMEELYGMIGELTVLVNAIKEDPMLVGAHFSSRTKIERLIRVTEALRTKMVDTHMLAINGIYKRLHRLVGDLAQKCHKQVEFFSSGEEIEIHKSTFEILYNFLVHMVRNSVDHGIELPEVRVANGKSEKGRIEISTNVTNDMITLLVQDDGQGLNKEAILNKALQNGLIDEDEELEEGEVFKLIFRPGFSTAVQVSEVSGRGVGMDVVLDSVKKLGGIIDVTSKHGEGTLFTISLPIMTSTSIIDGLVARVGKNFVIFPIFSVEQTFLPKPKDIQRAQGKRGEFVVYREMIIPLVHLANLFDIKDSDATHSEKVIFIVKVDKKLYGLQVDELLSQQQVVVENLKDHFKGLRGISGGAILGNGRFGLIMDTKAIVQYWNDPNRTE